MNTYSTADANHGRGPVAFIEDGARPGEWLARISSLTHYVELRIRPSGNGRDLDFMLEAGHFADAADDELTLPDPRSLAQPGSRTRTIDHARRVAWALPDATIDVQRAVHCARAAIAELPSPYPDVGRAFHRRPWRLGSTLMPPSASGEIQARE